MACVLILIVPAFSVSAQPTQKSSGSPEENVQFGSTHANIKPAQRTLVDELYRQYNQLAKQNLKPEQEYDDLSLSVRTTFEAVIQALMTTKLTKRELPYESQA